MPAIPARSAAAAAKPRPQARYDPQPVARQYAHLDSRTISYFDSAPKSSDARVLVLIHAFPLGAAMWEGQLKALPAGWRLIAPDLRGFGGSTIAQPDENPSMDDYANDVLDVLHHLEVSSAVVGGCSMGGYAAFGVLRRLSSLARAVILVDTRATADTPEARANRRNMLALLDREGPSGVARDMIPKLLGKTTLQERPDVEPLVRRLIKQQSAAALRGALQRLMLRPDSTPILRDLAVPTLIIVGEEDVLTPPDEARKMEASNSHARLVELPRTGHLPSLEQPRLFNETINSFLGQL
jgi:pimeloyl-ACP methyl ester carboxylesterase